MAQWNDYINLFPPQEQIVIQELINILGDDFGFSTYGAFESGFGSITPTYFQELSPSSNPFILALSSWLGEKASQGGDWSNYVLLFNSYDQSYVNLIVQANEGTPIQDFANQENTIRAESISNIPGFWNEYINMLSAYIQDMPSEITITSQPSNQNICEGSTATFTVVATGSGLSYQWRKNGSNISGANSPSYSIDEVNPSDAGNYSCVVTSSGGTSVTSDSASLTVKEEVDIATQPQGGTINWGDNKTFTVAATGDAPISYQWRKNGSNISGATSSSYTLNNTTTEDSGSYSCVVTNSCGSVTSNNANLTVEENLSIDTQPEDQITCPGSSATFSIEASGTGISYQWKKNGDNISGATSASLTIDNIDNSDEGNYSCEASISSGLTKTSSSASLTVKEEVVITTQPQSIEIDAGSNHTFQVEATGGSPISYQWRKDGGNISGATSNSLVLNNTTTDDSGSYDCLVSNSCGSVSSDVAELVVEEYIEITAQPLPQRVPLGETVLIEVSATATGTITYQWRKNGVPIPSSNSSIFVINELTLNDLGSYDCILSIASGLSKISTLIKLTMEEEVIINGHPESTEINWSDDHTLSVIVAGAEPISFQWRKNGVPISNATNSSYTLTSVTSIDSGQYDCIVSNSYGQKISSKATIEVSSFTSEIATVFGKVTNVREIPLENITVKVLDRTPVNSKVLATVTTDKEGRYVAEYLKSELINQNEYIANLVVQLFSDGDTEPSEISDLIEKSSVKEEVNFTTDAFLDASTEFSQIDTYLSNALEPEVNLSELDQDDIKLLVTKRFDQESIQAYIDASILNIEITTVSHEVFYGMLKKKVANTVGLLVKENESKIKNALASAIKSNIIQEFSETEINQVATNIQEEAGEVLADNDENSFKLILEKSDLSTAKKQKVSSAFAINPNNVSDILEDLEVNSELTATEVSELKRITSIVNLDLSTDGIFEVVESQVAQGVTLEDLASMSITSWESLIDNNDESLLSIPVGSGSESERKTNYAQKLRRSVEVQIPTEVFFKRLELDQDINSQSFDEFFASNPSFDFTTDKVASYLENNPLQSSDYSTGTDLSELEIELKKLERLFHLSDDFEKFETIKPLYQDGIGSAIEIAMMGESKFKNKFNQSLTDYQLDKMFLNATSVYGKTIHLLTKNGNQDPGPLVIGNKLDTNEEITGIADLKTLFGSYDYCKCSHCKSFYSPAAYLVDLLNFIDDDKLSEDNSTSPKSLLFKRRPEIKKLHLNCENTNTPIPYIDIVNEILENYISEDFVLDNVDYVNQTVHAAEVLKSLPQNVVASVYSQDLISSIYPNKLPFNLSYLESQLILEESGTSLADISEHFPFPSLTETEKKSLQASNYFNISKEEFEIITNTGQTPVSFKEIYGVSTNETDEDALAQIINPVSKFINRSKVSYDEFELLLKSKFINPQQKIVYFPEDGSCNTDNMTLGHNPLVIPDTDPEFNAAEGFSKKELIKFSQFYRLSKKLDWGLYELDAAIVYFGELDADNEMYINESLIEKLSFLEQLKSRFNLSIEEIALWIKDFQESTFLEENYYDQLFLNPKINDLDSISFPSFDDLASNGSSKKITDTDIKPIVCGALNIDAKQIDYLLNENIINDSLSISNLSLIFRISSFTRAIKVSISDYLSIQNLFEVEGISLTTESTLDKLQEFLEEKTTYDNQSLTFEEIEFLISKDTSTYELEEESIVEFISEIRKRFEELNLNTDSINIDASLTELQNEYYVSGSADLNYVNSVINTGTIGDYNSQEVVSAFGFFISSNELDTFVLDIGQSSSEEQRKYLVHKFLYRHHLIQTNVTDPVAEDFAALINVPIEHTGVLFKIEYPSQNNLKDELLDLDLLNSNTEISESNYTNLYRLIKLSNKLSVINLTLALNPIELDYILFGIPNSWFQYYLLPVLTNDTSVSYSEIKNLFSLRKLDVQVFNQGITLLEYLEKSAGLSTSSEKISLLSEVTRWYEPNIMELASSSGFDFDSDPNNFNGPDWIFKLAPCMKILDITNLDAITLLNLGIDSPDSNTVFTLKNTLSSSYGDEQWLEMAEKIYNQIRVEKRDALVAYIIANDDEVSSKVELYNRFLIDSEMSACQLTSRIKQSISAVQLFIQRIMLGQEEGFYLNKSKTTEYGWRKNYRVWEANRKVFLYPENYLIPELRDNQSKPFKDFEETLTQNELSHDVAAEAYQKYISGLPNYLNLEVNQLAYDHNQKVLHIIGNNQEEPKTFYYRSCQDNSLWTPWEDIPYPLGSNVLPIMHRGKLMLFWLIVKESKEKPQQTTTFDPNASISSSLDDTRSSYSLKLGYTTKNANGWEAMSETKEFYQTSSLEKAESMVLYPMENDEAELYVTISEHVPNNDGEVELIGAFKLVLGKLSNISLTNPDNPSYSGPTTTLNNMENPDLKFIFHTAIEPDEFTKYFMSNITDRALGSSMRRELNLAKYNSVFGDSLLTGLKYKNQRLKIPSKSELYIPYNRNSIYTWVSETPMSGGQIWSGKLDIESVRVLKSFTSREIVFIRPISEEFPLLAPVRWIEPFIIKNDEKQFIIFTKILNGKPNLIDITANRRVTEIPYNSSN